MLGGFSLVTFIISLYGFNDPLPQAQGACFTALTLMLMLHSYNCLALRGPFFLEKGFARAYWLHLSVLFGIGTLFFTFYTPVFETEVFDHRRPSWQNWLVAIAITFLFMAFSEIYKLIKRPFRARSHRKELEYQAAHDEYMIFNENSEKALTRREMRKLNKTQGKKSGDPRF